MRKNATFSGDASEAEKATVAVRLRGPLVWWQYRSIAIAEKRIAREPRNEIRVITPQYRFVMRPAKQRWNSRFFEEVLKPAIREAEDIILSTEAMSDMETMADYDHIVWRNLCDVLEMVYFKEER